MTAKRTVGSWLLAIGVILLVLLYIGYGSISPLIADPSSGAALLIMTIIVAFLVGSLLILGLYLIITSRKDDLANRSVSTGWSLTKQSIGKWWIVLILSGIALVAYSARFGGAYPYDSIVGLPLSIQIGYIAGNILSALLGRTIALGITTFALNLWSGISTFGWKDYFSNVNLLWKWAFGQILFQGIVFIGVILLIIPGIYWAVRFKFRDMFVIDQKMGPIEALKASWNLTQGSRWSVFSFGLTQVGVQILGALAFLIGIFWSTPTSLIAQVAAYKELLGETAPESDEEE